MMWLKHGRIAHAGVEQPQRGRIRLQQRELARGALGDLPLFVRRVDEREVLLPVVIKAKRPIGSAVGRCGSLVLGVLRGEEEALRFALPLMVVMPLLLLCSNCSAPFSFAARRLLLDETADFRRGLERDVLAVAQSDAELAVVDRLPAERRLGDAGAATKRLDLRQQRIRRALTHLVVSPRNERLLSVVLFRSGRHHTPSQKPLQTFLPIFVTALSWWAESHVTAP